jgi:hypothetical protein
VCFHRADTWLGIIRLLPRVDIRTLQYCSWKRRLPIGGEPKADEEVIWMLQTSDPSLPPCATAFSFSIPGLSGTAAGTADVPEPADVGAFGVAGGDNEVMPDAPHTGGRKCRAVSKPASPRDATGKPGEGELTKASNTHGHLSKDNHGHKRRQHLIDHPPNQQAMYVPPQDPLRDHGNQKPHGRQLGHDDEGDELLDGEAADQGHDEEHRVDEAEVHHGLAAELHGGEHAVDGEHVGPRQEEQAVEVGVGAPAAALGAEVLERLRCHRLRDGRRDEMRAQLGALGEHAVRQAAIGSLVCQEGVSREDSQGEETPGGRLLTRYWTWWCKRLAVVTGAAYFEIAPAISFRTLIMVTHPGRQVTLPM